ncbi:hypothetical protein [Arthrobacter sp. D2-10]
MSTVARKSLVTLSSVPPAAPSALVDDLWSFGGVNGPLLDDGATDTERLVAAAGAVESLEWELDRARSVLADAVESAASDGCSVEVIAESAGMTKEDVATLLWAARSERSWK